MNRGIEYSSVTFDLSNKLYIISRGMVLTVGGWYNLFKWKAKHLQLTVIISVIETVVCNQRQCV